MSASLCRFLRAVRTTPQLPSALPTLPGAVAFSGSVVDEESGPEEFTESNLNPAIKGQEPSEAFKDDE